MKSFFTIVLFLVAGCATHGEWQAPGIVAAGADNPAVTVTSDVDVIKLTPLAMQPPIDIRTEPDLAVSFERALERYVSEGQFRIISAEMTISTALSRQHVTFAMMVEANGHTHQTRYDWDTKNAGWGNKPVKLIPEYLDASAKLLAEKIKQ